MRKLILSTTIVALMAGPAMAHEVTAGSAPFTVDWSDSVSGGNITGTATFSDFVFSDNGTNLTFDITITNTTAQQSFSTSDWDSIRLVSFGWDTDPDATSASETGASVFTGVALETNFPSFQTVDVCAYSGNNCSGGANDGLRPVGAGTPDSDTFAMTLSGFPTATTSVDFGTDVPGGTELFDVKFQTNFGSFEFQDQPSNNVPEPASMALLGSGLVGLGALRRRRKAA